MANALDEAAKPLQDGGLAVAVFATAEEGASNASADAVGVVGG